MKVVRHRSTNGTLRPPQNCPPEVPKDVVPLTTGRPVDGHTPMRTYWEPTEEDISNILAGAVIELTIYGRVHPVLGMKVTMP
jgi:hypothetical protein